ncbi:nucleoporin protein Ndc1-Nup [Hygrophoropsis aurantiaca]|uniref:Nucleoporin protein Ndc1-Nup n=1 Tax=Hygrophoropsis aurantiaca TaxID=72124 RepID=A0ACB8ARE8_9AGAM|nr:nucleoporin protein Ndc1-Nup [Hygrophoropsis aurantiaca]
MSMASNGSARTRAITSTLAARSSPTIPPASQTYEPLVKSILRHRLLYSVFAHSIVFSFFIHVLFSGRDNSTIFGRLASPGIWMSAGVSWVAATLPVIMARKTCLTALPTPASTPSTAIKNAFAKSVVQRAFMIYTASAILLTSLYLGTASLGLGEDKLTIFVKSKKHPYYLNGRFIFLVSAQIWLAATFLIRNIMLDRFVFRWSKVSDASHLPHSPRNLLKMMLTMTLFTTFSFAIYNIAFGLARTIVLPILFRIPIIRSLLRPFSAHFLRGTWSLTLPLRHFSLEIRTFTLGLTTLASWEFAEALFDRYIPQPIKAAHTSADPNVALVSGISSTDVIFLHFAYAELCNIKSSTQRTALFGDQKYSPSLWNTLVRESLMRLGTDYQTFLRRGAPPAPTPAAPAASPPKPKDPPSTPLIRQPIYKAPQQSPMGTVLDSFASDSQLAGAADQIHVPELFRSVAAPLTAVAATTADVAVPRPVIHGVVARMRHQARGVVAKYCPPRASEAIGRWEQWWSRERTHKTVESCLPYRELDALVIEALSQFVCASLTEDRYGVVQRDIPRIIEAFLSFLTAIEEYQTEVNAMYVPPGPDELTGDLKVLEEKERKRIEVAKSAEVFGVVADALKVGIADIVRTFGDKLVAFKFPPKTARKLQSFVDYH